MRPTCFQVQPHFTSVCLVGCVAEHGMGLYNLSGSTFSSVSPDLHEAAQMDGASRLRRVISIDLPAIMPTIILLLIINAGQVMNLGFEKYILCKMMWNLRLSEVISTYVYKVGISASGRKLFVCYCNRYV